jgi:hypothetical protein
MRNEFSSSIPSALCTLDPFSLSRWYGRQSVRTAAYHSPPMNIGHMNARKLTYSSPLRPHDVVPLARGQSEFLGLFCRAVLFHSTASFATSTRPSLLGSSSRALMNTLISLPSSVISTSAPYLGSYGFDYL